MTHPKSTRCPHVAAEWQWEVSRGTCCTFDLSKVVAALERLEEVDLAKRVQAPVSAEGGIRLGDELEIRGGKILSRDCGEPETGEQRQFVSDCETVLCAGAWYRRLGTLGFGVMPSAA